jgi:hypothetical protein
VNDNVIVWDIETIRAGFIAPGARVTVSGITEIVS